MQSDESFSDDCQSLLSRLVNRTCKENVFFCLFQWSILHNKLSQTYWFMLVFTSLCWYCPVLTFPFKFKFILYRIFQNLLMGLNYGTHSKCIHLSGSSLNESRFQNAAFASLSSWWETKPWVFALMSSVLARTLISDQLTSFILTSIVLAWY